MAHCPRCPTRRESAIVTPVLSLCPEHALAVLEDVSRHLARTLAALEGATDHATDIVAAGVGG